MSTYFNYITIFTSIHIDVTTFLFRVFNKSNPLVMFFYENIYTDNYPESLEMSLSPFLNVQSLPGGYYL